MSGLKDNCIKTVFKDEEEVGKVTFVPSILKSSFDLDLEKEMQKRLKKYIRINTDIVKKMLVLISFTTEYMKQVQSISYFPSQL